MVVLLTKGREAAAYARSKSTTKSINKAIVAGAQKFALYDNNPLVLSRGARPVCVAVTVAPPKDGPAAGAAGAGAKPARHGKTAMSAIAEDLTRAEELVYLTKCGWGVVTQLDRPSF